MYSAHLVGLVGEERALVHGALHRGRYLVGEIQEGDN